jgi:hypothetical protein
MGDVRLDHVCAPEAERVEVEGVDRRLIAIVVEHAQAVGTRHGGSVRGVDGVVAVRGVFVCDLVDLVDLVLDFGHIRRALPLKLHLHVAQELRRAAQPHIMKVGLVGLIAFAFGSQPVEVKMVNVLTRFGFGFGATLSASFSDPELWMGALTHTDGSNVPAGNLLLNLLHTLIAAPATSLATTRGRVISIHVPREPGIGGHR